LLRVFRGKKDEKHYRDWIAKHSGFVANCWGIWQRGYMLHLADCYTLLNNQEHNPTVNGSAKICATREAELDAYAGCALQRCSKCMKMRETSASDYADRESHLVVQGGRIESNRRRH
jgi:hypothetical protein